MTNETCSPMAVGSTAPVGRILDEWADAAGHIWMSRAGETMTGWQVRRSELDRLVFAAVAAERERCARICDELQGVPATEPRHCAEDIRAGI